MELKLLQGRNQQGMSFTSPGCLGGNVKTVIIRSEGRLVLSDVRHSDRVPANSIVVDARIADALLAREGTAVLVEAADEDIPVCEEISLSVSSHTGLDSEKVASAVSKRVTDLKPYVEGLILRSGQELRADDLRLTFRVKSVTPMSTTHRAARVLWKRLNRVEIEATREAECYNLCCVFEMTSTVHRSDISMDGRMVTEWQAALQTASDLLNDLMSCEAVALFSAMMFSSSVETFKTYDPDSGQESEFCTVDTPDVAKMLSLWMSNREKDHRGSPASPGLAIERALGLAYDMTRKNGLPTVVLLFASGAYSAGPNPVKLATVDPGQERIAVFTVGLGSSADMDLLDAIAESGRGSGIRVSTDVDAEAVERAVHDWVHRRTGIVG
ncbi:MAG: VWA domain-containing protein [Candidatus Thorarchaeota archaeon]|nr:VWA domain-containing protein [Candidatus Thorarchaeota archaeon]